MHSSEINSERRLWRAVILNAIREARSQENANSSFGKSNYRDQIIKGARYWLTQDQDNYFTVCTLAGIEAKLLREKISGSLDKFESSKT
jgi:hypothetical protein